MWTSLECGHPWNADRSSLSRIDLSSTAKLLKFNADEFAEISNNINGGYINIYEIYYLVIT